MVFGTWDNISNWGKAYANISVNGVSVAGLSADEMKKTLQSTFTPRVSHAKVTIYANDQAREKGRRTLEELEAAAIADQISYEDSIVSNEWWQTDALSLKAAIPYDSAIQEALEVGREDGGILTRLNLMFDPRDIDMDVEFDEAAVDNLASEIDKAIGDERRDATVYVSGNTAEPVEGHDGSMVDRTWLANMISDAMISDSVPDSFVAQVTDAPSRITMEQAREMSDAVNRAISTSAQFTYHEKSWTAQDYDLGTWTVVSTVPDGDGFKLQPSIDPALAIPAVVKGANATLSSKGTRVCFEKNGDEITVRTEGSENIPEVEPAVESLNQTLYGDEGIAWGSQVPEMVAIEIGESDKPDELPFDQAVELGIVTTIGEYTTEFSDAEGTENRNHNIKLAADILNNGIIGSDGGIWDFNTESGDTNEEAGFWSAGSIIDGEYQDSIGGGICQVATTIFNAVYEGGLDVVERHNHSLYIASYPAGRDASVSYPELNFTWKNTLTSDILLKLSYTDTSVTAQLYSVYTGYHVDTEMGQWEEGGKYSTRFEEDDSLADGMYYLKTTGEDGSEISVTRTVYDDDDKVLSTEMFQSIYEPKDEVYVIGPNTDTSGLVRNTSSAMESGSTLEV